MEVQIENYRELLKLTQRSVFFGLLIAGISYSLAYIDKGEKLPKVPFLSIEFTSIVSLQVTLLVLYLGSGFFLGSQ
ncbi:hypothetical protein AADZ91_18135 [Colwelliaceae bacterium 6441]